MSRLRRRPLLGLLALAGLGVGVGTGAGAAPLSGALAAHDPTLWIDAQGGQWVFATGEGLARLHSRDGLHWERLPPLFTVAGKPAWWAAQVPAHRGLDVWAPKLFAHAQRLWVMYSISTFGKRTSAIGLASVPLSEGPGSDNWRDDGVLLTSHETRTNEPYNAIDPDFLADENGRLWMAWGSWWKGLFITALDPQTLRPRGEPIHLARRHGGIEAPTLLRRGGHVYLFMSWGLCCKGVDSTYEIRVGRAPGPTGPFVDRDGRPLLEGGGTPVLSGQGRWVGPGHQDVVGDEMVFHAYDAEAGGQPTLRRVTLRWTADGWPSA